MASLVEEMTDRFYRDLFWRFFHYKSLKGYLALFSGCFLPPPSTNPYLYQPPPHQPTNTTSSSRQRGVGSATKEVYQPHQPANTTSSPKDSNAPKKETRCRLLK